MSKVVVIGDSHLRWMDDVFVFPPNFTILAQGGAHVRLWTERKEELKNHNICMVMLGGEQSVAQAWWSHCVQGGDQKCLRPAYTVEEFL